MSNQKGIIKVQYTYMLNTIAFIKMMLKKNTKVLPKM